MEDKETMVTEEVTEQIAENTEHTAEETRQTPEKLFTQEDLDKYAGRRAARAEEKVRREYERMYGPLTDVLRAGTGKDSVEEITDSFRDYYGSRGVTIPQGGGFSARDIQKLASSDAQEIIDGGYEEVVEELGRLEKLGTDRMSERERMVYQSLKDHRGAAERNRELAQIGVPETVYNSPEFRKFASRYHENVPAADVYRDFEKLHDTSKVEPIGSMKNGSHIEEKTFYTPEEVDKLTRKDYENPVIMKRVRESMLRWKK